MNYQELHAYITAVQATLNSMQATNVPDAHLNCLKKIKRLTDSHIRKER